jgi:hypothetical protein
MFNKLYFYSGVKDGALTIDGASSGYGWRQSPDMDGGCLLQTWTSDTGDPPSTAYGGCTKMPSPRSSIF